MTKMIDLSGRRFGRWLAIEPTRQRYKGQICWLCRCDCGTERAVPSHQLISGLSKSCGCYRVDHGREHQSKFFLRHGESRDRQQTPEYRTWSSMRSRCLNPRHPNYRNYGARGIGICERWSKFENFIADMGRRPEGMSLDRIDNGLGYSPENCRWTSSKEQSRNQRNNHWVEIRGMRKTLAEWLELTGTLRRTYYMRMSTPGFDAERALFTAPLLNNGCPKDEDEQDRLDVIHRHLFSSSSP